MAERQQNISRTIGNKFGRLIIFTSILCFIFTIVQTTDLATLASWGAIFSKGRIQNEKILTELIAPNGYTSELLGDIAYKNGNHTNALLYYKNSLIENHSPRVLEKIHILENLTSSGNRVETGSQEEILTKASIQSSEERIKNDAKNRAHYFSSSSQSYAQNTKYFYSPKKDTIDW